MGFWYIIHIVICLFLIGVILLQDGKTGGLVSVSDNSQAMFGAGGASNFLTKVTTVLSIVFMVITLTITFVGTPDKSIAAGYTPPTSESSGVSAPANQDGSGERTVDGIGLDGDMADDVESIEMIRDPEKLPEEIRNLIEKENQERENAAEQPQAEEEKKEGDNDN